MPDRREFLTLAGVGGGSALLGACAGGASFDAGRAGAEGLDPTAGALLDELREIPVDDTHCHPLTFDDAQTDTDRFIERLALSAFPMDRYFPAGVYQRWQAGDAVERGALDAEFNVAATRDRVLEQAGETVFLRYLVKELAAFLACFGGGEALDNGSVIHIDFAPGSGTHVAVDGKMVDTIAGDDFYHALLRLWIGNPLQESMRLGLLGKTGE